MATPVICTCGSNKKNNGTTEIFNFNGVTCVSPSSVFRALETDPSLALVVIMSKVTYLQ